MSNYELRSLATGAMRRAICTAKRSNLDKVVRATRAKGSPELKFKIIRRMWQKTKPSTKKKIGSSF